MRLRHQTRLANPTNTLRKPPKGAHFSGVLGGSVTKRRKRRLRRRDHCSSIQTDFPLLPQKRQLYRSSRRTTTESSTHPHQHAHCTQLHKGHPPKRSTHTPPQDPGKENPGIIALFIGPAWSGLVRPGPSVH